MPFTDRSATSMSWAQRSGSGSLFTAHQNAPADRARAPAARLSRRCASDRRREHTVERVEMHAVKTRGTVASSALRPASKKVATYPTLQLTPPH